MRKKMNCFSRLICILLCTLFLTSCDFITNMFGGDNQDDGETKKTVLVVKNASHYSLKGVKWNKYEFSNASYEIWLYPGYECSKEVLPGTGNLSFYFTPKQTSGSEAKEMYCYTYDFVSLSEGDEVTFVFTDNTLVIEGANKENKNTLSKIQKTCEASLSLSYDGRDVSNGDTIQFESTVPDSSREISFTITNNGKDDLIFTGNKPISCDNSSFSVTQPSTSVLAQNKSLSFKVKFEPSEPGRLSGEISINTNDIKTPFVFYVSGTCTEPKPEIHILTGNGELANGGVINFGETAVGDSSEVEIFIKNEGTKKLTLTQNPAVAFYGEQNGFAIVSQPIPSILAGGESSFKVCFSPSETGEKSSVIKIASDDEDMYIYLNAAGYKNWPKFEVLSGTTKKENGFNMDLGTIRLDYSVQQTLQIKNTGTADVHISSFSSDSEYFTVTCPVTTVKVGQSTSAAIKFTPNNTVSTKYATFTIVTDCEESEFVFHVSGTGRNLSTDAFLTWVDYNEFNGVWDKGFSQTTYSYSMTFDDSFDSLIIPSTGYRKSTGAVVYINDIDMSKNSSATVPMSEGSVFKIKVVSEDKSKTNTYTFTIHLKKDFDTSSLDRLYVSTSKTGAKTDLLTQVGDYSTYYVAQSTIYISLVPTYSGEKLYINNTLVSANTVYGPYSTEMGVRIRSESESGLWYTEKTLFKD